MSKQKKNIILYIGNVFNNNIEDVKHFEKSQKKRFRTAVVTSNDINFDEKASQKGIEKKLDFIIKCDTKNINEIKKAIEFIKEDVVIIFCQLEVWMPLFARIANLFPKLNLPSAKSLEVCHSKLETRKRLMNEYPETTPKFMLLSGYRDLKTAAERIGFPCITKPLNLSKSRFVIRSNNMEELESNLKNTFSKIKKVVSHLHSENSPMILAEEFMEGEIYSIDAYINSRGKAYFTPIIKVATGKEIGIDDFFNYYRIAPAEVDRMDEKMAQKAAIKAIKATGPTSVTMHIELMRTQKGAWKIIELQTRPGGYRNEMLKLSFGINHHENDFLNKMGKKPIIPQKLKSYTAVLEIFPEKRGRLVSIQGIEQMKKMRSFFRYYQIKKTGDICGYSRDGYTYVLLVILNHRSKKTLYEDLERIKSDVKIVVE